MDVLDLADSYEELNDIMENTGVTAAGLAELLEKIANEEISADKVTDVVMAALEGFESLDTYVAKVLKNIEDFDWGVNENDVNDFIGDAWDNVVLPNVEAGSFNNSQLNKWMELMAGVGWDKGMTGS
jgi:Asp-tRNA(Asn)/Glu-tRNA(Gln) amidotransferase B subunit